MVISPLAEYLVFGVVREKSFNLEKTPTSFTTTLHTPFKGFESTQIRSSATRKPYRVVLNMQATYMSEIDFETHVNGYSLLDVSVQHQVY
jgi:hypothetical protein